MGLSAEHGSLTTRWIQAVVLVLVGAFVIVNLVVDLMYAVLDPRVRLAE
jgi:ABC-type dipeptide/oligopeptide/nickel transport system permease component